MKKAATKTVPLLLCALLSLACLCACREQQEASPLEQTAAYLMAAVPEPICSSVGGEWGVIGLARSGCEVEQAYFDGYYERLCQSVKDCGGVLDARKNTEYSRVILALTAIGYDPRDVVGYDLLLPLADYDKTLIQGINGPIWALIALDSGGYEIPRTASGTQATRERYVETILAGQGTQGGWALVKGESDVDITAMALQALAKYEEIDGVTDGCERALAWLSEQQLPNGGFYSYGAENSESVAQVIVALCELGIPLDDPRFVKNGATLSDAQMRFACEDGSFCHVLADGSNLMASEQALYSLAAAQRAACGKSSLYRMDDVSPACDETGHRESGAVEQG